jgi:nucleotide-binding universal stress UspA family protein
MTTSARSDVDRVVLIAVDDSENARRAVNYAGSMLGGRRGLALTLLHVISEPEEDYFARVEEKKKWIDHYRQRIAGVMEEYRRLLMQAGVAADDIRVHTPLRFCPSIAECILAERDASGAGTIVVGRQGLSRKEEFLFGSVSSKIVSHARNCAVWVVA